MFDYKEARRYAGQYALVAGLMWIVSFYCSIYGLTSPLLANIGWIIGLSSPFVVSRLLKKFGTEVAPLNFIRALWMSFQIFIYASLLTAVGQYVYFAYLDKGRMLEYYTQVFTIPEYRKLFSQIQVNTGTEDVASQFLTLLANISPIEITIELLFFNFIIGAILTLPAALMGRTIRK